jgi:SulP family sulfate permease
VFAESYSISSRFARAHDYEVDANQEMIAMGASNAAVGLFQGFAVSGSASRTAAVEGAGGRTQLVSLIAAGLVLVTAAWLTPLFTDLPEAVLGAIVIVAVRGFLRVSVMREYWRRDRQSFAIAASALAGVLVFDLLPGLIIAVGLSLILFIAHASGPRMVELQRTEGGDFVEVGSTTGLEAIDGLLVVRPDGGLFFGNVDRVRHAVVDLVRTASDPPGVLCLSLRASYRFDLPVLDSLGELDEDLQRYDVELWLVGVPSISRPQLDRDPLATRLGEHRIWHTVRGAAEYYEGTTPMGRTR